MHEHGVWPLWFTLILSSSLTTIYPDTCLSVCLSLLVCLSAFLSVYISLSIWLYVCLSVCLAVSLSVCLSSLSIFHFLSLYISRSLSIHPSICLYLLLSAYPSINLSLYLSVCLSVCLSVYPSIFLTDSLLLVIIFVSFTSLNKSCSHFIETLLWEEEVNQRPQVSVHTDCDTKKTPWPKFWILQRILKTGR